MKNRVTGKFFVGGFILILVLVLTLLFAINMASKQDKELFHRVELTNVDFDPCFSPNGDGQKEGMQLNAFFTGKPRKRVYAFLFIKKEEYFVRLLAGASRFSSSGEAVIGLDWDGKDWSGQMAADEDYNLTLYYFNFPSLFNSKGFKPKKAYEKLIRAMAKKSGSQVIEKWAGQVTVDTEDPNISISKPEHGFETFYENILTFGIAEEGDKLTINNQVVPVNNSTFTYTLPLSMGENHFTYVLEDCAGNRDTKVITVIRIEVPPLPEVDFQAEPESILLGESSTLSWNTTNGQSVSIDNDIGSVDLNGSIQVSPQVTTTFTITVIGPGGTVTQSLTVEVIVPTATVAISASPDSIYEGESSTLSWISENADSVNIDNGIGEVDLNGSIQVSPSSDITYVISASGPGGTAEDEVFIEVTIDPVKYTAIYGRVFEAESNSPLSQVSITASGKEAFTDGEGYWNLVFSSGGTYKIKITKEGYTAVYRKIYMETGKEDTVYSAYLTPLDPKTTPIGPEGGTHSNTDGTVEVVIPQGAVDEVKDIRITRLSSSKALPGDLNETDNLEYPIGFLFCADFGPDETQFNSPVKIRVQNTWGFEPGTPIPYAYWDKESQKWVGVNSMAVVDPQGEWLEAEVDHFTFYDVNSPMSFGGNKPIFDFYPFSPCYKCGLGSSVSVTTGAMRNSFTVPGVATKGGDTSVELVYSSNTAFPSQIIRVRDYHSYGFVRQPIGISMSFSSPFIASSGGSSGGSACLSVSRPFHFNAMQRPSPTSNTHFGQGAFLMTDTYPSGRKAGTGYQDINLSFSNLYSGEYYQAGQWGGMPTVSTGVGTLEPVYMKEERIEKVFLVSREHSSFGKGWCVRGVKKLHFEGDRVVVIDGDGSYEEFEKGVNYADAGYGTTLLSHNLQMLNYENMFLPLVVQESQGKLPTRFTTYSMPPGTDQNFTIDLGQERTIREIGLAFPQYWSGFNVWDYVNISTSVDNVNWEEWYQFGEPTLRHPTEEDELDPLDFKIKSPILEARTSRQVRYIKYRLGFPSANTAHPGSIIHRVYAIGGEHEYREINEEKWPKLEYDLVNSRYVLTEYSGAQTIFNNSGAMIEKKDRQGRTISYLYNGDKLEKILYPGDLFMEFFYDGNGHLSSIKDSSGRETQVITGSDGNVTKVIYPDNTNREFTYNDRGLMTTDKKGNAVKSYTWHDDWPILTKVTLPNGGERTIDAGALKYLLNDKSNDPENPIDFPFIEEHDGIDSYATLEDGREFTYKTGKGWESMSLNGKLKEKTSWANSRKNRVPVKIESGIDVDGAEVTEITYTNDLQVKKVMEKLTDAKWGFAGSDPNVYYEKKQGTCQITLNNLSLTYNENRLVSGITGFKSNMAFTYDTKGNLLEYKNVHYNKVTKYTYDPDNNLTSIEYPDGKKNEMTYDSNGLLLELKNNDGTKTTVTRNNRGEIETITDEENRTVTIQRDIMGRVIKETSPSGREVQYEWGTGCSSCSSDIKLTKIIDSGNKQWEFKYDIMGNTTEMIYPGGSKIQQAYDVAGRLTSFTNRRSQHIHYEYDTDGRMIKKITPEGVVDFRYDERDRLSEIEAADFHYKYQYGIPKCVSGYKTILQEENLKNGLWSQYVNNHLGLPEEYYDNFLWRKGYTYNYYFNGGNPIGFTPYLVRYSMRWQYGEYRINYNYDSGNRLYIRNNRYLSHKKTYNYDTNGLLSNLTYTGHPAFPDIDIDFTRDDSGLITSITGDKELNVNYNSDLEIEGVQHTLPQPFNESYSYDTRGNRLTSLTNSYTYNDLNQLTSTTTHTYNYDADGNLIEEKNKITTETKKYFYNSENRLTGFEHYPTAASPADTIAAYKYDILGRRLQKNVNGTVTNFSWENDNLALELDANYQPIRRYVYGLGKDDVEGYVEISEITGGMFDQSRQGWYSYIKDQVGTIYKVYSDNAKQIIDTRTYDTFGNLVNQTGSSTGNLGFQGKYYDQESGLYYFFQRYYNPANGRFINEDPIGFNGGLNMYGFVDNNPVNEIDPFGLQLGNPAREHAKIMYFGNQFRRESNSFTRAIRSLKFDFAGFANCMIGLQIFNTDKEEMRATLFQIYLEKKLIKGYYESMAKVCVNEASKNPKNFLSPKEFFKKVKKFGKFLKRFSVVTTVINSLMCLFSNTYF